jgi:hypothetical protein
VACPQFWENAKFFCARLARARLHVKKAAAQMVRADRSSNRRFLADGAAAVLGRRAAERR